MAEKKEEKILFCGSSSRQQQGKSNESRFIPFFFFILNFTFGFLLLAVKKMRQEMERLTPLRAVGADGLS